MQTRRVFYFFVLSAWIVAILLYLFADFKNILLPLATKPPLRIAINVWPGAAHAFVAEKKGFFSQNGVRVQLLLKTNLEESIEQYRLGEADGLFDVFSNTIMQVANGLQIKVVYISEYSQSGDVIVGRPELTSLADLKGRKVSFERVNSFSNIYVLKALEGYGLDETTVSFAVVPPSEVLTELEAGHIDAGHTWEPTTSMAVAKGYKILSQAGDIPGIITDILSFRESVIKNRPEEVQAVVQSLLEARAFVTSHMEEAVAIMAEAEQMTPEEMRNGLAGVFHLDAKANVAAMTPSQSMFSLYGSGQFIIQYLLSRGQLRHIPDLKDTMDARFVQAIQQRKAP